MTVLLPALRITTGSRGLAWARIYSLAPAGWRACGMTMAEGRALGLPRKMHDSLLVHW